MAAGTTIAELLIKVGADISELDKGLTRAERRFRSWGRSMERTGRSFTQAITVPLLAIGAATFASADQIDAALDNIRTGTGATGTAFKALREDFNNVFRDVPQQAGEVGKAIADINTRTGQTGSGLQKLTRQVLDLSRVTGEATNTIIPAATRVFGDWSIAVDKQSSALDYLFKVSQQTGIGVTRLGELIVQYGAPLRQMGYSFEQASAMMGKFEKEGVNIELVLGSLRIALTKMAREGIDNPAQALKGLIEQIKNAGSAGEANAIAIEKFGARAGPDMAAAIREGRFEIDGLMKSVSGSTETIAKAASDVEDWTEIWGSIRNQLLLALQPLGEPLREAASSAANLLGKIANSAKGALEGFAKLPQPVRNTIIAMAGMAAAIGPLLMLIGKIPVAFHAAAAGVRALSAALTFLEAHPIVLAITAIAALAYGIYKLIDYLHISTKDQIENTKRIIENTKAKQQQAEETKKLVTQYVDLQKKTNKTNVDLAQMKLILLEIKSQAPGLVTETGLVTDAIKKLGEESARTEKKLKALELRKLQLEEKELSAQLAKAKKVNEFYKWHEKETDKSMLHRYAHGGTIPEQERIDAAQKLVELELQLEKVRKSIYDIRNADEIAKAESDLVKAKEKQIALIDEQSAAADDLAAAEQTRYEIQHRNATALQQLQMEREKALKDAKGPEHRKAVMEDYADQERALMVEQAKEYEAIIEAETQAFERAYALRLQISGKSYEAEMATAISIYNRGWRELDQLAKETGESVYGRWLQLTAEFEQSKLEIHRKYAAQVAQVVETEMQAYEQALANHLGITASKAGGDTSAEGRKFAARASAQAELQEAINTYNQGWRELDRISRETGESIQGRWLQLITDYAKKELDIKTRLADAEKQIDREAARSALESERAKTDSAVAMWQRIIEVVEGYSDRLVGIFYGEDALRTQQLDRRLAAEKKAIAEMISDEKLKADVIKALEDDYALQREDIHASERRRQEEQMEWLRDRLRMMTGFANAESIWKRTVVSGARLAFAMPNIAHQVNMNHDVMGFGTGPGTVLQSLDERMRYANHMADETVRKLRDIDNKLDSDF